MKKLLTLLLLSPLAFAGIAELTLKDLMRLEEPNITSIKIMVFDIHNATN
jgi:hypothetical protein